MRPQVLSLDNRMTLSNSLVLCPSVLLHVSNSVHNHVILDGCGHNIVFVSSADEDVCSDLLAWVLSTAPGPSSTRLDRSATSSCSVLSGGGSPYSPLPYEYTPATRPLVRIDDGATLEIVNCRLVFEMGELEDWLSKGLGSYVTLKDVDISVTPPTCPATPCPAAPLTACCALKVMYPDTEAPAPPGAPPSLSPALPPLGQPCLRKVYQVHP